jgi:hypothetical protein
LVSLDINIFPLSEKKSAASSYHNKNKGYDMYELVTNKLWIYKVDWRKGE